MMYYLNKFVGVATSPLLLAMLGVAVGFVLAVRGRKKFGFLLIGFAVVWLWLWSTSLMTLLVGAPLEREFLVDGRVPQVEAFATAEAIVLLGGGMSICTNFSPYADMSSRADRVWQAVRLYRAGKAPKIISTGFSPQESTWPLLMDFGVPEDCVSFFYARNTEEEAKVVKNLGYKNVLLVTSAWHMKRARLMFGKYAHEIRVDCAPVDFDNSFKEDDFISFELLIPDVHTLSRNTDALHEWIGIVGYKVFR